MNMLPDSDEFLRILDQVSDPFFLLDTDYRFIHANNAYCNHMGLSPEKIKDMELKDVLPNEYAPILVEKYRRINLKNQSFDNIYPSALTDGSIIIEKWHNEGVFDNDGNLKYYYCIATLNLQVDSNLSQTDTDLVSSTLIHSSLIGFIVAIDQKILYVNKQAYNIFGLEMNIAPEAVSLSDFFEIILPGKNNEILKKVKTRKAVAHEVMVEHPDGHDCWISIICKPQRYQGKDTDLFIIEDITERKLNEIDTENAKNRLAAVMRIAKVGYWEKDFVNNRWIWSDEIYNIFNIQKGRPVTDKIITNFLKPETIADRNRRIESTLSNDTPSFHKFEYQIFPKNSDPKWIAGEAYYENGRFFGWTQDVTSRKKIEEVLREARDKAEESERLKSAFLANMSHEIRTPLNAILGFSDLLTKTSKSSDQQRFKKIIHQSSKLLLKIIDDILDFSAIESGKFELYPEHTGINEIFEEISEFYSDHEHEGIELIINTPEEKIYVWADHERLKQVFINLINNAFKYTAEGTVRLSCEKNNGTAMFKISDTGIGIHPKDIDLIFDRFFQADSFAKGTGLGLAISKSIIHQMGGRLSVNSVPGKGSTFRFTIPIAP